MTTIETPPPASPEPAPPPRRSGFYVAPWLLAVLGGLMLLVVGFVIGRASDHGDHGRRRPFFRGGDDPGGHPGLRLLLALVVLALIVTAVVLLVRHFSTPRGEVATSDAATLPVATHAEQVLADRFARGEIDEAEFVSRRDALRT